MKYINFNYFKEFDGMTVEFDAYPLLNENYRVTATVKLKGKLFLEYTCDAHKSYFEDLIFERSGNHLVCTSNTLRNFAPAIANQIDGWDMDYPN